jgi:ElaB/YqjD/DUF883 family membrane-anchored ribosome-binding protein
MSSSARNAADAETPVDLQAITSDIAALKHDLATLMRHLKLGATDGMRGATDGMRAAARNAAEQIGDESLRAYEALAAQGERTAKSIGRHVEEQPVVSLLIAFAIGFLGSRMLSR